MSALLSFLGGSAFRMIWGEISAYMTAKQSHGFELERMRLQDMLDDKTHSRQLEAVELQHKLGVEVIRVAEEAALSKIDAEAFKQAAADVGKPTGIRFLDLWNGSVRPLLATLAIGMVVFEVARNGFDLSEWDRELIGAILGMYVADRTLGKRGK